MIYRCLRKIIDEEPLSLQERLAIQDSSFCSRIEHEGIASLFYPLLQSAPVLSGTFIKTVRYAYENAVVFKDYCIQKLKELQPALSTNGRVVLIQGFSLFDCIYQEPVCRSMGDIDLYLPDGNVASVRSVLSENGFTALQPYENVWRFKSLHIDLHDDLWGCDRVPARAAFKPHQPVEFRACSIVPGFFVLSDRFLLLHSLFHSLKHAFNKAVWMADMLLLYRKGYFSLLHDIDKLNLGQIGLERLRYFKLLPQAETHSVPQCNGSNAKNMKSGLRDYALQLGKKQGIGELCLALSCPTWFETLRYLWSAFFLPRKRLVEIYGNHPFFIVHMMRFWVTVKHMIRSSP
ncbi:MAG: nucleotidyltransferase family protein [Chitinivibrionales bacterium]|nr:nucleotidyltransferase family protein [Chitinivibrionales bacterium]